MSRDALIGRDAELAELQALLSRARDGSGGIAFIEGEPGIGKTSLCAAAVDDAAADSFAIARGAASALEADRPFAAFIGALGLSPSADDERLAAIGTLIQRGTTDNADARYLAVEQITDLVEERALDRPLLIALEDVHWADPATLLVVHRLAATTRQLPLVLLATMRPLPRIPQLQQLLDGLDARTIELEPLSAAQVSSVAGAHLDATPGPRLLGVLAGAAGNPLFVSEVLRAVEQEGLLARDGATVDVAEASLPPSVSLTILRRLTYLSEAALEMLRIASVLGTTFTLAELERVTERPAPELLPLIDETAKLGVLGEDGDDIAFRHDLIRDAIYDDMLAPVRTGLHHRTARALIDADAPPMRIAPHITLGARPGDMHAVTWLRDTAHQMRSMPLVAADLLSRAVALAGERADEDLRAHHVGSLLRVGRADAVKAARAAVAKDGTIRARLLLGQALVMNWQAREAAEICDAIAADPKATPVERATALASTAAARSMFDREQAAREAETALSYAGEIDDPYAMHVSRIALSNCYVFDGRMTEALALFTGTNEHQLEVDFQSSPVAFGIGVWPIALPFAYIVLDRFDLAEDALAVWADERNPRFGPFISYHTEQTALERWQGRWDDAVATAEAGIAYCQENGIQSTVSLLRDNLCNIAIHRGRPAEAAAHLATMPRAMHTRALLADSIGDTDTLAQMLEGFTATVHSSEKWMIEMWTGGPDWVRLYTEAGDQDSARILTEVVEEAPNRCRIPTTEGAALRARGLLEGDADLLIQAVEKHRTGPRPFLTAQTAEEAAVALARNGRRDDAITFLREALDVYEHVDAAYCIARADARLRKLGVRRGKGRAAAKPTIGWESLTDSERKVVALVPDGLTYREIGERLFISKRTVESHIAHVFRKLDVSSRRELADEVRRRGG